MPGRHKGPTSRPSRYLPIAQYLATQEAETLTLSLAQIEEILGFPIAVYAYVDDTWWRDTTHAYVRAWTALGWEAHLRLRERAVLFTRTTRQEGGAMPPRPRGGTWPYRGFTVRYHHLAAPERLSVAPGALWWAEILEAPAISPPTAATYAAVRDTAERAIDALLASGHPAPPEPVVSRGHFQHLANFLASRPATDTIIVLGFAELEALLGGPLSRSARTKQSYWRHSGYRHVRRLLAAGWVAQPQLDAQRVAFTRISSEERAMRERHLPPPTRQSKYQPLADFLATQEATSVRLTLAEIEALIGSALPTTAYVNTSFWRTISEAGVRALQAVGWEAQRLDRSGGAVIFTRMDTDEAAEHATA